MSRDPRVLLAKITEHVASAKSSRGIEDWAHTAIDLLEDAAKELAAALARPHPHQDRSVENLERLADDLAVRVKGWDSYSAWPLDDRAVAAAGHFLGYAWSFVPLQDGGIQLERHDSGCDIEIAFDADGTLSDAYAKKATDEFKVHGATPPWERP